MSEVSYGNDGCRWCRIAGQGHRRGFAWVGHRMGDRISQPAHRKARVGGVHTVGVAGRKVFGPAEQIEADPVRGDDDLWRAASLVHR
jgi:hypothetical protein